MRTAPRPARGGGVRQAGHPTLRAAAGRLDRPGDDGDRAQRNAAEQRAPLEKYTLSFENHELFYVIRKEQVDGEMNYIVSYAWGNYQNDLVTAIYGRLLLLMVGVIVASWVPCLLLPRYLSRPLV